MTLFTVQTFPNAQTWDTSRAITHLKTRRSYMGSKAVIVLDAECISKSNTLKLITLSRNPLAELTILKICNCSAVTAIESKVIEDRNISSQD